MSGSLAAANDNNNTTPRKRNKSASTLEGNLNVDSINEQEKEFNNATHLFIINENATKESEPKLASSNDIRKTVTAKMNNQTASSIVIIAKYWDYSSFSSDHF